MALEVLPRTMGCFSQFIHVLVTSAMYCPFTVVCRFFFQDISLPSFPLCHMLVSHSGGPQDIFIRSADVSLRL